MAHVQGQRAYPTFKVQPVALLEDPVDKRGVRLAQVGNVHEHDTSVVWEQIVHLVPARQSRVVAYRRAMLTIHPTDHGTLILASSPHASSNRQRRAPVNQLHLLPEEHVAIWSMGRGAKVFVSIIEGRAEKKEHSGNGVQSSQYL